MQTSSSKETTVIPVSIVTTRKGLKRESRPSPPPDDVFTYRRLRRIIGILGISLPIVLVLLSIIVYTTPGVRPSISDYYYTHFREIFTGTLCGVGLFLICYKGHNNPKIWKNDNFLTNIAGVMALGVAFFPTFPADRGEKIFTLVASDATWLGWLHYSFAATLFISFSILAINVFTIGQNEDPSLKKSWMNENNIYRFCGYSILVFIGLIALSAKVELFANSTLVFEALSLFAFGTAWLIKGRILGDKGKIGEKIYKERNAKIQPNKLDTTS
jgi:hypothetical protein